MRSSPNSLAYKYNAHGESYHMVWRQLSTVGTDGIFCPEPPLSFPLETPHTWSINLLWEISLPYITSSFRKLLTALGVGIYAKPI